MSKQIPDNWNFYNESYLVLILDSLRNLVLYMVKVKDSLDSIFFNAVEEDKSLNQANYNSVKRKYIFDITKSEDLIQVGDNQLVGEKEIENNYKKEQERRNINHVYQFTQIID